MPQDENLLQRRLAWLRYLPRPLRPWAASRMIGVAIPFVRTARLEIERLDTEVCRIRLRPRRRVRNHIGGVHAAAAALLAETATGLVFGMNLAPDQLALLKRMELDYLSRMQGNLVAEATVPTGSADRLRAEARGELRVAVRIEDTSGAEPVRASLIWAWTSRRAKT